MPETSIKTGDVDFILPVDKIAAKLIELAGSGNG
jgi:chemotaxis response regulator CheB